MAFRKGYPGTAAGPKALAAEMDMVRDQPVTVLENDAARAGGVDNARDIPGYYYTTNTADDTRMSYRLAAANNGTLDPLERASLGLPDQTLRDPAAAKLLQNFKVELTQKDVDWFEERKDTKEQIRFDEWLTRVIDVSDPGESRWLQDMYPEFWNRREKYIDDEINAEAALAKIRLRGVKNMNDLKLIYAMNTGRWAPATKPLWAGSPAGGVGFKKGWLSLADYNGRSAARLTGPGNGKFSANPLAGRPAAP